MTPATAFVLFGVGSAIVVEVVESCRRAGHTVIAGVANRDVPSYLPASIPVRPVAQIAGEFVGLPCLCPLFTPANRFIAVQEARQYGLTFSRELVDPTAIVASDLVCGVATYVNAGVILGAATTIDDHVLINRGASVGHHGTVGEFASIGPGAIVAGQVTIGRGAMIGAGAIVGPGVSIGPHAVVGAGAVVLKDVPGWRRAFGSPARIVGEALEGF